MHHRYDRNILLEEIGEEGQKRLLNGKVLVVGAGGLGSPALLYLAAAGIGTIGIADGDTVDESNLQRQVIHSTSDIGTPKVESARDKIRLLNPDVNVIIYREFLTSDNITDVISEYDFVIDATDGFEAKYLINDACVAANKPFSYGGVFKLQGQTLTCVNGSANLRSIYPEKPAKGSVPPCSQVGVIGTVPGIIGTIQATEAIKFIAGFGRLLTNRLLCLDASSLQFTTLNI